MPPTLEKRESRWLRSRLAPSLSHVTAGDGLPLAAQSRVAVAPASTAAFDGRAMNVGARAAFAEAGIKIVR